MRASRESVLRWNEVVVEVQSIVENERLSDGRKLKLDNFFPLDPDSREDIAPDGACPFLGQEAWVSAEGRFDPCCAPDAQRRSLGEFGNLNEESFMDVWQGDSYRMLGRNYRTYPLCMTCNMRRPVEQGGG